MSHRLARALVWSVGACLLAATYGVLHDQLTYTLSSHYYSHFKFIQFGIPSVLQSRVGVGMVGALATWWMGLVIGLPIAAVCSFIRHQASRTFWHAAILAVAVTILSGAIGLIYSTAIGPDTRLWIPDGLEGDDALWFLHVGRMHNAAYLGGAIGLSAGLILTGFRLRRDRRL